MPRTRRSTTRTSHSLGDPALRSIRTGLAGVNRAVARANPGETGDRKPVHSVYGGAHLFKAESAQKNGAIAHAVLDE